MPFELIMVALQEIWFFKFYITFGTNLDSLVKKILETPKEKSMLMDRRIILDGSKNIWLFKFKYFSEINDKLKPKK